MNRKITHEAIIKSKKAQFINEEIRDLFGIELVTCPDCNCILSSNDRRIKYTVYCPVCKIDILSSDCPILFD